MKLRKIQYWIKFIYNVKIDFNSIKKKKILIFDKELSHTGCKLLGIKNYNILHARKEVYNFSILFYLLIRFKLNLLNYYIRYIEISDPNIVLTFIDNNFIFYKLKKYVKDKKKIFISIQNGHRMAFGDIFGYLNNKKIKNLSADMIFTFNRNIIKEYRKKISSQYLAVGSIKNNFVRINKTKKKKNLLFISPFRPIMYKILTNNISMSDYEERFGKKYTYYQRQGINFELPKLLRKFCKENKLKLDILGASDNLQEKAFYDTVLEKNYRFIKKRNTFSNYKVLDEYELIVSTYSTLGYEALGRGKKICFFSPKISRFEKSYIFGWPYIKKKQGLFFSDKIDYCSIKKILNNVRNISNNLWQKKISTNKKNIMTYDSGNLTIKKFLKNKLNEINK